MDEVDLNLVAVDKVNLIVGSIIKVDLILVAIE